MLKLIKQLNGIYNNSKLESHKTRFHATTSSKYLNILSTKIGIIIIIFWFLLE